MTPKAKGFALHVGSGNHREPELISSVGCSAIHARDGSTTLAWVRRRKPQRDFGCENCRQPGEAGVMTRTFKRQEGPGQSRRRPALVEEGGRRDRAKQQKGTRFKKNGF